MIVIAGGIAAGLLAGGLVLLGLAFQAPPHTQETTLADHKADWGERLKDLATWAGASLVLCLVISLSTRWPALGIGVGCLVWVARLWIIARQERQEFHLKTEAISDWVDMVKDSLAGGAGLSQAIESTTPVAPEAIRHQVLRLSTYQRVGTLSDALREFGASLAHPTSDLVVMALISASENQASDLPKLLAKTAEQARSRNNAVLQIETERSKLYAEARAMVIVIAVLGLMIAMVARGFLAPYSTLTGQFVLGIVMALVVGSAVLLVQAGRPQPERRLFVPEGEEL